MQSLLSEMSEFLSNIHRGEPPYMDGRIVTSATVSVDLKEVGRLQKMIKAQVDDDIGKQKDDDVEYRDRMIRLNNAMEYWQNRFFGQFTSHQAVLKEFNQLRGMAVAEANKVVKKN